MPYLIAIMLIPFIIWGTKVFVVIWEILCSPIYLVFFITDLLNGTNKRKKQLHSITTFTPFSALALLFLALMIYNYVRWGINYSGSLYRELQIQMLGGFIFCVFFSIIWRGTAGRMHRRNQIRDDYVKQGVSKSEALKLANEKVKELETIDPNEDSVTKRIWGRTNSESEDDKPDVLGGLWAMMKVIIVIALVIALVVIGTRTTIFFSIFEFLGLI